MREATESVGGTGGGDGRSEVTHDGCHQAKILKRMATMFALSR